MNRREQAFITLERLDRKLSQDGKRPLGKNQRLALRAMLEHGGWPGTGWIWDNSSSTVRILDSLVRRGLVVRYQTPVLTHAGKRFPEGHQFHNATSTRYRVHEDVLRG